MEYKDRLKAARRHAKLTQAGLAKAVGITQTSISDLERGKSVSSSYNASIAKACGISALWLEREEGAMVVDSQNPPSGSENLDVRHLDQDGVDVSSLPAPLAQKISSYRSKVSIDRFDVAGSMGPGTEPPDLHNIVDSMTLDAAWVRQNLVYTAVENIKLISGRGDSMSPTIKNGDPLLVDVGITSVECDAIYFFLMGRQLQIKRIQRHLDGLTILSDNDRYKPVEIAAEREEELTIFAQVIYGWNGQKF